MDNINNLEHLRKAVAVVARRLRDENGNYDIEACWTIGVLSAIAEVDLNELERAAEVYSRITFASFGDKKIQAIMIVRTHLKCGLKEGKEIVEGISQANASAEVAKIIKEECERECGSSVIVRPWESSSPMIGRGLDLTPEPNCDNVPF